MPDAGVGGPPVSALVVYNSNPGGRRAGSGRRAARARARGPVHRRPRALPDRHRRLGRHRAPRDDAARALGHPPRVRPSLRDAQPPGDRAARRGAAEQRDLPAARGAHGTRRSGAAPTTTDADSRRRSTRAPSKLQGVTLETLLERGWMRLERPDARICPFAEGGFPTPSGKCEFYSQRLAEMGLDPLPDVHAAVRVAGERARARGALSAGADLVAGAPVPQLDVRERRLAAPRAREPECVLHPDDAAPRGIADGTRVVVHNDRGEFTRRRARGGRDPPGRRSGRRRLVGEASPDGRNANETTSQRETDMGRGPCSTTISSRSPPTPLQD